MKKNASSLMTEEHFWNIIDQSQQGYYLDRLLSPLSVEEIYGFIYWWRYFAAQTYRQDLWAVAYVVRGGCSDDSFDYFRSWLISQGKKIVYDAIENPDSLCEVFEEIVDSGQRLEPTDETADSIPIVVLDNKTKEKGYYFNHINEYEMPVYPNDINFEWDEDDEQSIRNVCPKTFDRWWNSSDNVISQNIAEFEKEKAKIGFWGKLKSIFSE